MTKPTIILVHGSGLGAWSWEPAARLLRANGLDVRSLDLKGFGSRAGELTADIQLSDHVADVEAAIDAVTGPVLLVGHSYGSYVVCEAAAARSGAVAGVVAVDGPPARKKESLLDQIPALAPLFESLAAADAPGLLEALPAELLGLQPSDLPEGVVPTRSPLQPSRDPAKTDAADLACPGLFIGFTDFPPSADFAANAEAIGWQVRMIKGGHMTAFLDPQPVAEAIDAFSRLLEANPGR